MPQNNLKATLEYEVPQAIKIGHLNAENVTLSLIQHYFLDKAI